MLSENGRYERTEYAGRKENEKQLVCKICGNKIFIKNFEIGERYLCNNCGSPLEELIGVN